MNWEAAGAVGEVIGAAAVVISVVYLAAQVKKQTQEAKLSATRELAEQGLQVQARFVSDFECVAVYAKAVQDYDSLPDDQRLWVAIMFQQFCRVMEQQILHIEKGNADPLYFESFRNLFLEGLTFPGFQQWWSKSGNLFSAYFRNYVDEMLVEARAKGYVSTFRKENENAT